ncbi:MAG: CHAD domain-containing protein [Phycisphaerales bacterium]
MGYEFNRAESWPENIRRVAIEQLDRSVRDLRATELDQPTTIHECRKRCKKMRGLVRLIRPHHPDIYRLENQRFRNAARLLATMRDASVLVDLHDTLVKSSPPKAPEAFAERIHAQLGARRTTETNGVSPEMRLRAFETDMRDAMRAAHEWPIIDLGFDTIAEGLRRVYRKARRGLARAEAESTADTMHEWRKAVKYHWYHVRLLRAARPETLAGRADRLRTLSSRLGEEHDLSVYIETLHGLPRRQDETKAFKRWIRFVENRREGLRVEALELGHELFPDRPRVFVADIADAWARMAKRDRATRPLAV